MADVARYIRKKPDKNSLGIFPHTYKTPYIDYAPMGVIMNCE